MQLVQESSGVTSELAAGWLHNKVNVLTSPLSPAQ